MDGHMLLPSSGPVISDMNAKLEISIVLAALLLGTTAHLLRLPALELISLLMTAIGFGMLIYRVTDTEKDP
jgi:hypothetical protein